MKDDENGFKKFLIIWIIFVVIIVGVPIINIILISNGWHLRIFGSSGTKVIDGKTYVEVSESVGWDYRKVTYYSEYNKFVFKKDENTYIEEYFDFNNYKSPNSRYYYENGKCVKKLNFDDKCDVIEKL